MHSMVICPNHTAEIPENTPHGQVNSSPHPSAQPQHTVQSCTRYYKKLGHCKPLTQCSDKKTIIIKELERDGISFSGFNS